MTNALSVIALARDFVGI